MQDMMTSEIPWISELLRGKGYEDFKWIRPATLPVAHWVRMKCYFGCDENRKNASCPPYVPSVIECREFFSEYEKGVFVHVTSTVPKGKHREWAKGHQRKFLDVEKQVFLGGMVRAFALPMDPCNLCEECPGTPEECRYPYERRPTMEALAVDVFTAARRLGYPITVKKGPDEPTDRYALLLVE
jgi:predicted metal-binding protein